MVYDFRSDTVTKPTQALKALVPALAQESLGDDVMGEDAITTELETYAAQLLGFEAGLFVASGTMGNLLAVLCHCQRGEQFLAGDKSHIVYYESGGSAVFGGVLPRVFPLSEHGTGDLRAIEKLIMPEDDHYCPTSLICLENTFNGYPLATSYTAEVAALAKRHGLRLHIDGARIFNAAVAHGVPVRDVVADTDSVTFCLSKGLGAPIGSVLCGETSFIKKARHLRKALGGGWRQSGVIAAMGLQALRDNPSRLHEDHALAKATADQLCLNPALRVDLTHVKTNMVFVQLKKNDPEPLSAFLAERNIRVSASNPMRLVFHQDVTKEAADALVKAVADHYA